MAQFIPMDQPQSDALKFSGTAANSIDIMNKLGKQTPEMIAQARGAAAGMFAKNLDAFGGTMSEVNFVRFSPSGQIISFDITTSGAQ